MRWRLIVLEDGAAQPDGTLVDRAGQPTGLRITPGGYLIYDGDGRVVGALTLTGGVYDNKSRPVASLRRHDLKETR